MRIPDVIATMRSMPRQDRSLDLAPGSVRDFRELARRRLPRQMFDYIDGGAYEETTMRANSQDLASLKLRQRVMKDVSALSLATSVVGHELAMPVVLAPVGLAGMFARRAEVQAALAAQAKGIAFCESTVSICGIREVASATSQPFWFQLYVMRDRSYAEGLMRQAHEAGWSVLVLTVDLAVVGARYRDTRNGLVGTPSLRIKLGRALDLAKHPSWLVDVGIQGKPLTFGNLESAVPGARKPDQFKEWVDAQFDPSVTWEDLEWVRKNWPGKIVVKGLLDVDDAKEAVARGVDGIVVSNHGGRQLDDTPSTINALRTIAPAVGNDVDVMVDGGIRSGLDIVKALALGARAVLIGRAWAYAVAAAGQQGVEEVLDIIRGELEVALSLVGVPNVDALTPDVLV